MRIWSLHPQYLDAKGLVALWRETLLAKHVLEGKTKGYTNHPQLQRFKAQAQPVEAIHAYLQTVWDEAHARGYRFDATKFDAQAQATVIPVTQGQLDYEKEHLLRKLAQRDPEKYAKVALLEQWHVHPLFRLVPGGVEEWERV